MILKIHLKPLGKFFFGGENRFSEAGNKDNRRDTYVLHSNYYPQQTGFLGLIRNQLLQQNGLLRDNSDTISDKSKAAELIGLHGFKMGYDGNYGVIRRISPVYLANIAGDALPPAPLDDVNADADKKLSFAIMYGKPLLRNFSGKISLNNGVRVSDNGYLDLSQAFHKIEQVGITKAARPDGNPVVGSDDEAGYYYQNYLMRAPKSEVQGYVCYVEIADEPAVRLEDAMVEFGGERSAFRMSVEKAEAFPTPALSYTHTQIEQIEGSAQAKRLICLSPAAVDITTLRAESLLIVSRSLDFRHFETSVAGTTHHQKVDHNGGLKESKRFQFIDRGSVVYFRPEKQSNITDLFNAKGLSRIGYNHYTLL